ncbi:MAG: hypothetical protein KC613_06620 [Myxococcales bacterium]|nr:hypothetical protein [Myxococcales bacterium]
MREALHKTGTFEAFYKANAPVGQRLRIRGVISTEHRDLDGELIRQDGADYTELSKAGWLNDDHKKGASNALGQVVQVFPVQVRDKATGQMVKATGIEGYLLEDGDGRRIWEKARALQKAKASRRYGFSVEGAVLARDPQDPTIVTKCRVREVAITRNPVNPYTSLEVMEKSLGAVRKALEAGSTFPADGAMNAGQIMAAVPQDLAGWAITDDPLLFTDLKNFIQPGQPSRRRLTKAQAEAFVRLHAPQATPDQIRDVLQRSLTRSTR